MSKASKLLNRINSINESKRSKIQESQWVILDQDGSPLPGPFKTELAAHDELQKMLDKSDSPDDYVNSYKVAPSKE